MSTMATECPKCGGRAHWNSDDDITRCDEPDCGWFGIDDPEAPWRETQKHFRKLEYERRQS